MSTSFELLITSPPDREELVVEVWSGSEQLAEVRKSEAGPRVQIYATKSQRWWDFSYAEFVEILQRAHEELHK